MPTLSAVEFDGEDTLHLTLTGTGFLTSSAVEMRGVILPGRFLSSTTLEAAYPIDSLRNPFTGVVVINPSPGGGRSSLDSVKYVTKPRAAPQLTSLSPDFIPLDKDSSVITLTGANFSRGGYIYFGAGDYIGGMYVSRTRMYVTVPRNRTLLARRESVYVDVGPPGGGRTRALVFEIRNPKPQITALRQAATPAGQPSFEIQCDGSGFLATSTVTYNGTNRAFRRFGTESIAFTLTESDLSRAGRFPITIANSGPGGGVSDTAIFTVTGSTPRIRSIPANGGSVGLGFALMVHGSGFVPGAVVRWNGSDRPTTYVSSSRLSATISGADMAVVGTNEIVVRNTAPETGQSNAVSFQVRSFATGSANFQVVDIDGMGIAWARRSGRLYVSARFTDAVYRGRVLEIDPVTGSVLRSLAVGADLDALAISDDETTLYVVERSSHAVRRITVSTFTVDLDIPFEQGRIPYDVEVLPGRAGTVVVTGEAGQLLAASPGPVIIYFDGIARRGQALTTLAAGRLAFAGDSSTVYIFNDQSSPSGLGRATIDAMGSIASGGASDLIATGSGDILGFQGRIYGTDGTVVDGDRLERVGAIGSGMYTMLIDGDLGRAYAMFAGRIAVYDLNSFALLGSVAIAAALGGPTVEVLPHPRMTRCGVDCIAWTDAKQIVIARSAMFAP